MRQYDFIYHRADQLPREYRDQLWKFVSIQISLEGGMANETGIERPMFLKVPDAKHRHFLDYKMAGEAVHAYGLFQIAKDIGHDPHAFVAEIRRDPQKSRALDAFKLDYIYQTHLAFEVFSMLTELAGGIASIAMMGSTYVPWAMWNARNFLDEGMEHSVISTNNVREYVESGQRTEAQSLYDRLYPHALDLFGRAGSENEERYLRFGIKTMTNTECRVIWIRMIRDRTAQAGLTFPKDPYQGVRGRYDECREGVESNWGVAVVQHAQQLASAVAPPTLPGTRSGESTAQPPVE